MLLLAMPVQAKSVTPAALDKMALAGLHVCEVDSLYNLKHGGMARLCLMYRDASKPGKRWYGIYGEGQNGQIESVVEGDDATVTWKRVWRKRGGVPAIPNQRGLSI